MSSQTLPSSVNPLVIRTEFAQEATWKRICELIRAPVQLPGDAFYAHVDFLDDVAFRGLNKDQLVALAPRNYNHSVLFVVDGTTLRQADFPILVVDLNTQRGRSFRAIPSSIQAIENNLSIANMDFFEFADSAGKDGVFRGFPQR
ncbi:DUF6924 domain-containing protein [Paludibaculum fermentans]|uniref:DUF6924 domain-containing protein n=1 Tax=Paludibaculum fermentans TaxID=1473598 RepID=UPI003EBED84E